MFGTVTKYFREKGYGFIRGEDVALILAIYHIKK